MLTLMIANDRLTWRNPASGGTGGDGAAVKTWIEIKVIASRITYLGKCLCANDTVLYIQYDLMETWVRSPVTAYLVP
jgi:hypothetical protein